MTDCKSRHPEQSRRINRVTNTYACSAHTHAIIPYLQLDGKAVKACVQCALHVRKHTISLRSVPSASASASAPCTLHPLSSRRRILSSPLHPLPPSSPPFYKLTWVHAYLYHFRPCSLLATSFPFFAASERTGDW